MPNTLKTIGILLIALSILIASGKKIIPKLAKDHPIKRLPVVMYMYSLK